MDEALLRGEETILFVDDEELIIDVGRQMMEKIGYTVYTASCGNEAIERYQEHRRDIDLVILDLMLPDMGGEEVYDKLKKINSGVTVLLSSGYNIEDRATDILSCGCNGFIQKPFLLKRLSSKIREILDNKEYVAVIDKLELAS